MSFTKDIAGAAMPYALLIAGAGVVYLFRDKIKEWLWSNAGEQITSLPGDAVDATQTVIQDQIESVTDLNPSTGGWWVSAVESVALWLSGGSQTSEQTQISPITGNPIEYQPSGVSEYVATNAYAPGVALIPENQDTIWRPSAEKIGQIFDKSEFRPGETDVYEIWRLTGTGTTQILATQAGVGPSQGGIDPSAWDTVFKAGTYEVVWL